MKLIQTLFAAIDGATIMGYIPIIIVFGGLLIFMFVMNKRSNAKRQQEIDNLRNSIHVGDEIKTIGGIVATIVSIEKVEEEQRYVIETGIEGSKHTMVIDAQAIYQNLTYMKKMQEQELKRKEEQEKAKAQRHRLKDAEAASDKTESDETKGDRDETENNASDENK